MGCVTTMEIKDKKRLTKIISFLVMGDGSVYKNRGKGNCLFSLSMTEEHQDFIDYCSGVLSNITSSKTLLYKRDAPRKNLIKIYTPVHPMFNVLRDRIYFGTYKSLDQHALKLLDFEALAILYMCDGCLGKHIRNGTESYTITLNLCRLSYGDQIMLKRHLKDLLDLEFNVVKTGGKYFTLRLRNKDIDKFMSGVAPFILDSFKYKILSERLAPEVLGGDIV